MSITIVSTFIVQASFTIVTYDHQNMFIIQATGEVESEREKRKEMERQSIVERERKTEG